MTVIAARVGSSKYPVCISDHALVNLLEFCQNYSKYNIVVVSDEYFLNNGDCYPEISELFGKYETLYLSGGVESKSIEVYQKVVSWIFNKNLTRDGLLIAVGGGVIGDLSAFVASTYMRGTGLVLVPTTTTAMIDSSIGGKTGINFSNQVNALGSYYHPAAVFMDLRFLATLSERDYSAGLCEAIKMSITSDKHQAQRLGDYSSDLMKEEKDLSKLHDIVLWSVKEKLYHVGDDPNEKSIRLILNYGHTFGQAFETYYGLHQDNLRHGEAVSLGMVCAAKAISLIEKTDASRDLLSFTKNILKSYKLPLCLRASRDNPVPSIDALVANLVNDKKRTAKGNRFILVPTIGSAEIYTIDDLEIIQEGFREVLSS